MNGVWLISPSPFRSEPLSQGLDSSGDASSPFPFTPPLVLDLSYFSNCALSPSQHGTGACNGAAEKVDKPKSQIENHHTCVDRETLYDELWQMPGTKARLPPPA